MLRTVRVMRTPEVVLQLDLSRATLPALETDHTLTPNIFGFAQQKLDESTLGGRASGTTSKRPYSIAISI